MCERSRSQASSAALGIEGFNDFKIGDQLEIIEMKEIAKKLSSGNTDGSNIRMKRVEASCEKRSVR
jgi:hypothetical protein